jgi:hypothetical protein
LETFLHCLLDCPKVSLALMDYWTSMEQIGCLGDIHQFLTTQCNWLQWKWGILFHSRYHMGGFSYKRQPFNILRSFLLYYLWFKICHLLCQKNIPLVQKQDFYVTSNVIAIIIKSTIVTSFFTKSNNTNACSN